MRSAILRASLDSVPPIHPSVALSLKEEGVQQFKLIVVCLSFQQHRDGKTFTTERVPYYPEGRVLDRKPALDKGRKTFLPKA